MFRYYYINRAWIVSPVARRTYRLAATLSLLLCLFLMVWAYMGGFPATDLPLLKFLVFVGALGAATTMVAMEYFLFSFDKSSAFKRLFWFCILLFPPLGPPLYCFTVYSRSDFFKEATPDFFIRTSA